MLLLWLSLAFLLGALPFSVWVGRFVLGVDIRQFGDGNPGATNVLRAGSLPAYALALALDISKGAIPAGLANVVFNITGWPLVLICLAPIIGHAYSPFLNWNGGKALAAAGGAWLGLGWPYFATAIIGVVIWSLIVKPSGYAVMLTMASIMAVLFWLNPGWEHDAIWFAQTLLFIWKHRDDLRQQPELTFPRKAAHRKEHPS